MLLHLLALGAFTNADDFGNPFHERALRRFGMFEGDAEGKPAGGGERAPVPFAEVEKKNKRIAELKRRVEELEAKAPDLAKLTGERDEAIKRADNAEKDMALRDIGVTDPDDRAFIRDRYKMATDGVKDPPAFGDWVGEQGEKKWFKSMVDIAPAPGEAPENARSDFAANKGKPPAEGEGEGKGEGKGDGKPAPKANPNAVRSPVRPPSFNPNAGTNGANPQTRPAYTREEIAAMSPDEYREHKANVRAAQRDGRIE